VGGMVFDAIGPRAPFVLLGVMNLLVMAAAVYVRYKESGQAYRAKAVNV
jgi:hypothetical protein